MGKRVKAVLVLCALLPSILGAGAWAAEQEFQERPIPMGVSGGNIRDSSRLYCCSGTLGGLVQDRTGAQYILSNNHVLARTNRATIGEMIIQPGLIDKEPGCIPDPNDAIGNLSAFTPISFRRTSTNRVDAAIAEVQNGQVDPSGRILNIGEPSNVTLVPLPGLPVQKMGRTTGLTTGVITATNVSLTIKYDRQCGTGMQTARFKGQIMISGQGFSSGGDSGALIVEDCSPNPRAVGLLFGGGSSTTIANPITDVLSQFSVSMVGRGGYCTSSPGQAGVPPMTMQYGTLLKHVESAGKVKERYEDAILKIRDVVGIGVGLSDTAPGQVVIEAYVKKPVPFMKKRIPEMLDGIPVKIVETGEIVAY